MCMLAGKCVVWSHIDFFFLLLPYIKSMHSSENLYTHASIHMELDMFLFIFFHAFRCNRVKAKKKKKKEIEAKRREKKIDKMVLITNHVRMHISASASVVCMKRCAI